MVSYAMPAAISRVKQSNGSLKIKTLGSFETSVTIIRQAYLRKGLESSATSQ